MNRRRGMRPIERVQTHHCEPCGKRSHLTRDLAKRAARSTPRGPDGALHAYRCPHDPDVWHVGHMRAGDRQDYRDRRQP